MPSKRLRVLLVLAFLSAIGPLPGMAQTTNGSLQGKITDEAGQPIAGALVEIRGPALQAYLGTATDLTGQYMLPFIPVGTAYEVKVEATGFNAVIRRDVNIDLGTTVILPFVLGQGKTELVVTAAAPLIDTRRTEVGANISDRMINAIPLARNAEGIAYLAPGVVPSGLSTGDPAISGASGPENSYLVNGLETQSPAVGTNTGSLNFDFIEATEVKTGGVDAEYGAFMGGMINSITKSGGNEFHGSLFAYYFDDGMGAAERPIDHPGYLASWMASRKSFKQYDVGGSFGGYFIKDKLWFYAAYDYNKTETGFYGSDRKDDLVTLNGRPAYSWSRNKDYTQSAADPQYAFKATWNISADHKLALSVFGNNYEERYANRLSTPSEAAAWWAYDEHSYGVSLQWNATWTPRFFTEAVLGRRQSAASVAPQAEAARSENEYFYRYSGYRVYPVGPPNSYNPYTGAIDLADWRFSNGGGMYGDWLERNDQLRLKGTNLFQGLGRHELSYGLQVYDMRYNEYWDWTGRGYTEGYPGDLFYGCTTTTGASIRWQYNRSSPTSYLFRGMGLLSEPHRETTQTYTAYWAQDNWNLTDHFMLKLGLRLDQIHMKGSENTRNVADAISPGHGYSDGRAHTIGINDEWAPRIGFTWDVAHNSKSKLYGFYGIYYERIPNFVALRALSDEVTHFSYFYDAALTQPYPVAAYHYTYGLYDTQIEGGPGGGPLKGSYNTEALLGFQYEIKPDLSVGVRAIYRAIGRVVEDVSFDTGYSYIVTNPDQWSDVWIPDTLGRPGYRYKLPKPVRIYRALELTVDKRFSNHWMMQGSYVLSRLEGNYEGLFLNDTEDFGANIGPAYDLPEMMVNSYGLLPNDRTHVLKLYGAYFFENIPLELSANFFLASGRPISKLGYNDAYGYFYNYVTPRGSAGRLPTLWTLDLGAQYTFKIWKSNLALRVDIFNVTNNQVTTKVDQNYYLSGAMETPVINPYYGVETNHQPARRIRLALRWTF